MLRSNLSGLDSAMTTGTGHLKGWSFSLTSFYIMDPNLFGRGSWNDVKKIRMVIEYNADGTKSINTEISKQLRLFE
jgi:hypothetical protein